MDKNTWIGFALIAAIIVGFSFLNRPSKEELAERKRVQDSIALVQAQEMEAKLISEEIAQQLAAEKAAQEKAFYENLQPGDIINIRYSRSSGGGHAMLYVGNGQIIHSGGGNISYGSADTIETSISIV